MIKRIPRRRLAMPAAPIAILALVAAALSAAPVAAGSYGYGSEAGAASPGVASASVQVGTTSTSALGAVLTGPNGMTLYTLSSDPNDGSVCTGGCLTAWPPLLVASGGTVAGPSGGSLTFATFTRADDGSVQASADGRPLYYFGGDSAPGQTNGEGIKGAGGVWHVAAATATGAAAGVAPVAVAGGAYGAASGSDAATSSTGRAPAPSGMDVPIGPIVLILALVLIAVAVIAVRRTRPVGNG